MADIKVIGILYKDDDELIQLDDQDDSHVKGVLYVHYRQNPKSQETKCWKPDPTMPNL